MGKPWGGKREFIKLSGKLATLERYDFESAILPFVRAIWPEALGTSAGRSFDRRGIDHLVWSDETSFPLVVQAKGFDAGTRQLGSDQARQCLKSIAAFRDSGIKAKTYALVHNRDGRDESFRIRVSEALSALSEDGAAEEAALLDRQAFLRRAFDAMFERLELGLREQSAALGRAELARQYIDLSPVKEVPYRQSLLVLDQHSLRSMEAGTEELGDPAPLIADGNDWMLIGEFGFGKTTAILRSQSGKRQILYVPAKIISEAVNSTKDFLVQCIDTDSILSPFAEEDRATLHLLIRPGLEYLLKDADLQWSLVLDGLDESAFLSRRGGFQHLFNILRDVRIPVVLSMRSEFWASRLEEFRASVGAEAAHGERQFQRVRVLELQPWSDDEILALLRRHLGREKAPERLGNLLRLEEMIERGRFESVYGDIPRRPLFLGQIIESVAAEGLPGERVGRAELMARWVRMKAQRDIFEAARGGGGRLPVRSPDESSDSVVRWAWDLMAQAAALMTRQTPEGLEILPDCRLDEVMTYAFDTYGITEPTGLILHSLLLPVRPSLSPVDQRIRFAHRAFQEFFLADYLLRENQDAILEDAAALPEAVVGWMAELKAMAADGPADSFED